MCYASVEICTGMRSFIPYYNRSTTVVRSYYICTTITERKLFFENYRRCLQDYWPYSTVESVIYRYVHMCVITCQLATVVAHFVFVVNTYSV